MNQKSWLLNLSLLKTHPAYRAVFIARFISILSLGLLGVAVPVQIQAMTHSSWLVGLSVTLTGSAMFIGLMVGGVLADRYERKKLILLARFLVLHKELDPDDDELTRTRKVRRGFIAQKYGVLVDALYEGRTEQFIETQVKFEDGRTGSVSATLKISDAKTFTPVKAAA